jgi:hypothetical protein
MGPFVKTNLSLSLETAAAEDASNSLELSGRILTPTLILLSIACSGLAEIFCLSWTRVLCLNGHNALNLANFISSTRGGDIWVGVRLIKP